PIPFHETRATQPAVRPRPAFLVTGSTERQTPVRFSTSRLPPPRRNIRFVRVRVPRWRPQVADRRSAGPPVLLQPASADPVVPRPAESTSTEFAPDLPAIVRASSRRPLAVPA